ncbi:Hus1-like protein-domain-containing protein [Chaetomidium leptoderma]|uniref:Hus1-like protein-domain-containing protein n=1 Tax=Chaetomidium leptoderma TaxID=669021 RepID=A0AAN6ZVZ9_9PEZI|nr:Hus1-like protein-domain-containing protein [Chaetomidium leptoderma]
MSDTSLASASSHPLATSRPIARWPGFSPLSLIFRLPLRPAIAAKRLITFTITTVVGLAMGRTGGGKSDIKSHTISSSEKQVSTVQIEDKTCPICQEPIGVRNAEGVKEGWSMLPCGHSFGSHCIKRYLGIAADEHPLCPVCRHVAYYAACGHPVLPFVLKSNGTHPDLVTDASGKIRPPGSEEDLMTVACTYCLMPDEPEGQPRGRQHRRLSALKTPFRWLRAMVPVVRKRKAPNDSPGDESSSGQDHRPSRQNARGSGRRRPQASDEPWEGPKLTAALNSLEKIAWVRLDDDTVRFTVIPDTGSQVWASLSVDLIFDNYHLQSAEANNTINLELPLGPLQRALKSAVGSSYASLRLTKRDGIPMLSMTIHTMTKDGGGAQGGGGFAGAGRHNNNNNHPDPDDPFGDAADLFPQESLELTMKREREKIITQDIPVRVLHPDTVETIMQPKVREPDVHIQLPPLLQLKAISDRFTKLALTTTSSSRGGGGGGSGSGGGGSGSSQNPKLTLSANMHGSLRLRLTTETLDITSVWDGLENPELDPGQLAMPLDEHPSTKFKEAGPDKWATVRVDGKDWSRVLSVGRLEGRVIACFADDHALILYVYVPHVDDVGAEDVVTYYVSSYSA